MLYYTNHSWCSDSCWNNETFDGEVQVGIGKKVDTYSINKYKNDNILNPDWNNLILEENIFDEERYKNHIEMISRMDGQNIPITEEKKEYYKKNSYTKIPMLKTEVIEWLNINVADKKGTNENTPLEERKGWAIYNKESLIQESKISFTIFFYRQIDALKFINTFSVFKEPTRYFDYFNDVASEMKTEKVVEILNSCGNNVKIEEIILNDLSSDRTIIEGLSPYDYKLIDWEKDNDCDDCNLTKEEAEILISLSLN